MVKLGNDRHDVQNTHIQYACEVAWEYVKPKDAQRLLGGNTGLIFKKTLSEQLSKNIEEFNDSIMIEEIFNKLERLPVRIGGSLKA